MRRLAALVSVALVAVLVAVRAEAVTFTFNPVADAYVSSANPSGNYGNTASLRVDASPTVRSYLRFTVQGLSAPVAKATLKLYALEGSVDGYQVRTVGDDTWNEQSITYTNAPGFSSPVATSRPFESAGWTRVNVTSALSGNGTYSFALTSTSARTTRFSSSEGGQPPQLVIETEPDTTAPSRPTGVHLTAVDFNWVKVRWSASSDTFGVDGYTVYRSGVQLATVSGSRLRYSDSTVAPGTRYTYQVDAFDEAGNRSAKSSVVAITTPQLPSYPVVAAAGDIACNPGSSSFNGGNGTSTTCRQKHVSNSLVNAGFTAVLPLGDTQYEHGEYNNFLNSYDPSWGRVKSITRPAVGNHEYGTPGADGYFDYFGDLAGDPSKGYYSYDLGNWHLIVLNSHIDRDGDSAQVAWLKSDLEANTKPCVLAYWHHARWSSGPHGDDSSVSAFWDELYAAGADVVLVAHDHLYERFARQTPAGEADATGIREFVVGTGGKSLYGVSHVKPNSLVRNDATFGVLMLKLQSSSYSWRFVPEAGKLFTDSGTTACH